MTALELLTNINQVLFVGLFWLSSHGQRGSRRART